MSFILGTAQFGQTYGITNKNGAITDDKAAAIIATAIEKGINTVDTAEAYGQSQNILGAVLPPSMHVITKISGSDSADQMKSHIERSLQALRRDHVDGVLLHNPDCLLGEEKTRIWASLENFKKEGWTKRIGISVYDPQTYLTLSRHFTFDIVQFPCNILDQRFLRHDVQTRLQEQSTERHARSAFLQGILLCTEENTPQQFRRFEDVFDLVRKQAAENRLSLLAHCLAFTHAQKLAQTIDETVIGVESQEQLLQITDAMAEAQSSPAIEWSKLATNNQNIIDPRLWSAAC